MVHLTKGCSTLPNFDCSILFDFLSTFDSFSRPCQSSSRLASCAPLAGSVALSSHWNPRSLIGPIFEPGLGHFLPYQIFKLYQMMFYFLNVILFIFFVIMFDLWTRPDRYRFIVLSVYSFIVAFIRDLQSIVQVNLVRVRRTLPVAGWRFGYPWPEFFTRSGIWLSSSLTHNLVGPSRLFDFLSIE